MCTLTLHVITYPNLPLLKVLNPPMYYTNTIYYPGITMEPYLESQSRYHLKLAPIDHHYYKQQWNLHLHTQSDVRFCWTFEIRMSPWHLALCWCKGWCRHSRVMKVDHKQVSLRDNGNQNTQWIKLHDNIFHTGNFSPSHLAFPMSGFHSPVPLHIVLLGPTITNPGEQDKDTLLPSLAGFLKPTNDSMLLTFRAAGFPQSTEALQ